MTGNDDHTGFVSEIFTSLQGEGPRVGELQVFVRMAGCDRCCSFCDTPGSRNAATPSTLIEMGRGKRWRRRNPWSPAELAQVVAGFGRLPVCVTGGEPLLQAEFVGSFVGMLKPGKRIVLETHGLLAAPMAAVSDVCYAVSADAKLQSSTGEPTDWEEFSRFLRAAGPEKTWVKSVITSDTTRADALEAFNRVAESSDSIPFVLQPVTPRNGVKAPDLDFVLELARDGLSVLKEVRVIPQVHRLAGWK